MPEGLAAAMTPDERRDLVRFLLDLGRPGPRPPATCSAHVARAGRRSRYDRAPLHPEDWPNWQHPVNRDRVYDFYAKEAEYFSKQPDVPALAARRTPASTAGSSATGATRATTTWADGRWNQTDLGTLLCGVFRGAGVTVPKGVCVRLGDRGELAACFNPETLCYEAVWSGGFVKFSAKRHGFLDGLDPGRHPPAPSRGQEARRAVRLSRLLPPRQRGSSSRTGSATSRCSTPPGSRTASSPASSRRPTSIRWRS